MLKEVQGHKGGRVVSSKVDVQLSAGQVHLKDVLILCQVCARTSTDFLGPQVLPLLAWILLCISCK